jgi:hypothetical protein
MREFVQPHLAHLCPTSAQSRFSGTCSVQNALEHHYVAVQVRNLKKQTSMKPGLRFMARELKPGGFELRVNWIRELVQPHHSHLNRGAPVASAGRLQSTHAWWGQTQVSGIAASAGAAAASSGPRRGVLAAPPSSLLLLSPPAAVAVDADAAARAAGVAGKHTRWYTAGH